MTQATSETAIETTPIDPPSTYTEPHGINDRGQIVGGFIDSTGLHGFLDIAGNFTQLDVPGSTFTDALGINDRGQIVGDFEDSTGVHGFLATPEHGFGKLFS